MNTYTIKKKGAVLDWAQIPSVEMTHYYREHVPEISATAQLCYDEKALYVRLTAKEQNIRAEYNDLLGAPCEDSCLEFFFCPNPDDTRYLNFEYNPNCCLYLGLATNINDLVRLIPEFGYPFNPVAKRTENGWEISYEIPYEFVGRFFPGFSPKSGDTIRANFYKCGDLTEKEHYLSWNLITGETLSFHRPSDFGLCTFE